MTLDEKRLATEILAPRQHRSSHGIGASEIAAVLGLNPYRSPYQLFEEKTGEAAPFAGNEATRWGQIVEPAILAAYTEKTGATIHIPPASLYHPSLEWARATPDAVVIADSALPPERGNWAHLVQAKNTGYWTGKSWSDAPPVHVVIQVQWELFVTGLSRGDAVASIGGEFPTIFRIDRDETLIAGAVEAATAFWECVQGKKAPPVDDSRECARYWAKRATPATTRLVAYAEAAPIVRTYYNAWRVQRQADSELKLAKNDIAALCAQDGAAGVETPDGPIRWQERSSRRTNWEAVARALAPSDLELERAIRDHTVEGDPIRAVVAPRAWGKD